MPLARNRQIAVAIEQGPAQATTLTASHAKFRVQGEPEYEVLPEMYRSDEIRGTLTADQGQPGAQMARLKFTLKLAGHSDGASEPVWSLLMRACGFRAIAIHKATIGPVTGGPFRHGETITDASGDLATVFFNTYTGQTTLYYIDPRSSAGAAIAASGITGAITGGTSGATATISANDDNAGWGWYPLSRDTVFVDYSAAGVLTGTLAVDAIVKGNTSGFKGIITRHDLVNKTIRIRIYSGIVTSGETISLVSDPVNHNVTACVASATTYMEDIPTVSAGMWLDGKKRLAKGMRGTWSLDAEVGKPALMTFEFFGQHSSHADSAPLSGVTYADKVPAPLMLSASCLWGVETDTTNPFTADYTARATKLTLAMNAPVEPLRDFTTASGVRRHEITGREPQGTLDPELDLEASYPFTANQLAGTIARANFLIGSVAGNRFQLQLPGVQFEQDGISTTQGILRNALGFRCTGGQMTNASNSPGTDNEVILALINV